MTVKIVKRLLAIAQSSFDFNHRAGRRGKEWAIESEVTYQAAKRIEALEAALAPFAKYHELSLRGSRIDTFVVGTYSYNTQGEPDAIDLETRHFRKAATLLNKK